MPESAEIRALVERGLPARHGHRPILGVTHQRVSQVVAERHDFPEPAKVIGRHRLWRRKDVMRWRDEQPRVGLPPTSPSHGDR